MASVDSTLTEFGEVAKLGPDCILLVFNSDCAF